METIKIDPDGKYLLIITGERAKEIDIGHTADYLNEWWRSRKKFCIISTGEFEVRVERLDKVG